MGASIESALVAFVFDASVGSRLTLQKNRDGFTAQVTGEVQRGNGQTFGLAEAQELRRQLNRQR